MKLRVLIVEDSQIDAQLLSREIRKGDYDLEWKQVETADQLESALDSEQWDVVLADYNLPQFSAPEALEILKSRDLDIPFIIVSGVINDEIAVESLKAGAHDFMSKNNLSRLLPAVARELRDARIRMERRQTEQALRDSQALFTSFMNNSPAIAFMKDELGRYTYVNQPFEKKFNVRQASILGKTDLDIWPAGTATQIREHDTSVLQSDRTIESFEVIPTTDGSSRYWWVFRFPFRDGNGRSYVGGVAIDVTGYSGLE